MSEGTGPSPAVAVRPDDITTWTLPQVLSAQARERPEAVFICTADGTEFTYAEVHARSLSMAGGLADLGVQQGDRVALLMDNSADLLFAWFAINLLGAVEVPINTASVGPNLVHTCNNSGAEVAVMDPGHLDRVMDVGAELTSLRAIVTTAPAAEQAGGFALRSLASLSAAPPARLPEVSPRDVGAIMYTSGTTGPSKGVLMPHAHMYLFALQVVEQLALTPRDRYLVTLPLFHANAQLMQVYASMIAGGRVELVSHFSASEWIDQVRDRSATVSSLLGVMAQFIHAQPRRDIDAEHQLTRMVTIPLPAGIATDFESRFGARCVEAYGMTEICLPLYRPREGQLRPGSCGKVLDDWFEVQIVDEDTDEPVPTGQVGEVVVRPKVPFTTFLGYHAMPEQTVEAWRNLWFHTGDSAWCDPDGYFYFADRTRDRIRRRGENISSYDIELVLTRHPDVQEAAAVAVPATEGEDEILALIVLRDGVEPDLRALAAHCATELPYFAVPRYLQVLPHLPKTASGKVLKRELRAQSVDKAWDRVAAGMLFDRGQRAVPPS